MTDFLDFQQGSLVEGILKAVETAESLPGKDVAFVFVGKGLMIDPDNSELLKAYEHFGNNTLTGITQPLFDRNIAHGITFVKQENYDDTVSRLLNTYNSDIYHRVVFFVSNEIELANKEK